MLKFRMLTADDIEVKVKQVINDYQTGKPKGVSCLLYKTARTDMDMLDEAVGPENWESDYKEIKGNLYAGIGVRTAEDKPWVWKWDCGIESREDGEGNQKKGEASDAFKRAGFKWGIGRELYSSPFIYIPADCVRFDAKGRCNDRFEVAEAAFSDGRKCERLVIRNEKTGAIVYTFGKQPPRREPPKQEPKQEPKREPPVPQTLCSHCHRPIQPVMKKDGSIVPVKTVIENSTKEYGEPLCLACCKAMAAAKKMMGEAK